jgi:hypothetical protein
LRFAAAGVFGDADFVFPLVFPFAIGFATAFATRAGFFARATFLGARFFGAADRAAPALRGDFFDAFFFLAAMGVGA